MPEWSWWWRRWLERCGAVGLGSGWCTTLTGGLSTRACGLELGCGPRGFWPVEAQGGRLRGRPVRGVFATLDREVLRRCRFRTREEARSVLFAYLEGFYNRRRRHSALGYLSPEEFERRWSAAPESVSVTLSTKAG